MNCNQVDSLLQSYIDGDLPEMQLKALAEHRQNCSACEGALNKAVQIRALVKEMTVPPHSEGFVDRVLNKAAEDNDSQKASLYKIAAGAMAAGFAAWFIVASTFFSAHLDMQENVYRVLVNNEVQTINVAIESEHDLNGVQVSIELTPNLELSGFGNRTSINWDTQIKKGTNVIKLPIVGLAAGNGEIITRINLNGKEKIMRISTDYQIPGNVWHQTKLKATV